MYDETTSKKESIDCVTGDEELRGGAMGGMSS
jgi:hypothetical protein